jgi:hypothetical protein
MRGRGADPKRVVDYNRFASQFTGTNQFSSQQPTGAVTPLNAAPQSPRVGVGDVATAQSSFPTTTPQVGDRTTNTTTSAINVQPSTPKMGMLTGVQGEGTKLPDLDTSGVPQRTN